MIYNPLFKLVGKNEKEKYFLARKRAEKHLENNKEQYKNDIIPVEQIFLSKIKAKIENEYI